jgi:Spc7 kinetochore protein
MTGIRFLDELSAPRRSTILPSQLQSSQRPAETTLSDYVVAMIIDAPQLELYSHVAADLQRWIEHSKEIYRQAEEEATKVTPTLFREYSMADEETQAELLVPFPSPPCPVKETDLCPSATTQAHQGQQSCHGEIAVV